MSELDTAINKTKENVSKFLNFKKIGQFALGLGATLFISQVFTPSETYARPASQSNTEVELFKQNININSKKVGEYYQGYTVLCSVLNLGARVDCSDLNNKTNQLLEVLDQNRPKASIENLSKFIDLEIETLKIQLEMYLKLDPKISMIDESQQKEIRLEFNKKLGKYNQRQNAVLQQLQDGKIKGDTALGTILQNSQFYRPFPKLELESDTPADNKPGPLW